MKNLKNVCIVHTNPNRNTKSIYDEYKKSKGGVLTVICPITNKELRLPFKNEKERKLWIEIKKECKQLMVAA